MCVWYGAQVHVGTAPMRSYASICRAALAAHSGLTAQSFHPHSSTPLTLRLVGTATRAPSEASRPAKSRVASPGEMVLSLWAREISLNSVAPHTSALRTRVD